MGVGNAVASSIRGNHWSPQFCRQCKGSQPAEIELTHPGRQESLVKLPVGHRKDAEDGKPVNPAPLNSRHPGGAGRDRRLPPHPTDRAPGRMSPHSPRFRQMPCTLIVDSRHQGLSPISMAPDHLLMPTSQSCRVRHVAGQPHATTRRMTAPGWLSSPLPPRDMASRRGPVKAPAAGLLL